MADEPTVYVVEDDHAVLDSLHLLLTAAGHRALGFETSERFLAARPHGPGCLVCDVHLPGMSGLDLMRHLKAIGSTLPVVFITGHGTIDMAVTAIKEGALDFIEKPFDQERLLARVSEALAALNDRQPAQAAVVDPHLAARIDDLSLRQRQVMALVAAGKSNKEIGSDLGISPRTVEVYRAHVMSKLGVKTMAELVRIALKSGVMS